MKITSAASLTREGLPDAPEGEWLDTLLDKTNTMDDQVARAFSGGFSIGDNTPWKFVPLNMVHGVEYKVKNPFADPSMPVKMISVASAVGLVLGGDGKPTGSTYTLVQPQLGWRPTGQPDNSVFIAVQYAPPLGNIRTFVNAVQSINNGGASTPRQWNGVIHQVGTNLTWSSGANTKVTCVMAGLVEVSFQILFASAAGGYREAYAIKNAAVGPYPAYDLTPGGTFAGMSSTGQYLVAAGDYLTTNVFQNSGGALNTDAAVDAMCASYVAPDPATTARVTLLFQGA